MKRLFLALLLTLSLALPASAVIVEYTLVENDVASTVGSVRTTAYPLGDASPAEGGFTQTNPPAHVTLGRSTFHSVGLEWDVGSDDTDHNATITCEYRLSGDDFSNCFNLMRQDWTPFYNGTTYSAVDNFAGSIMFLTPGERYQIRLTYDDPDNTDARDGETYTFTADTRAVPTKPTGGTTYYVTTGAGSGNAGTSIDPFEGFAEAFGTVTAGDILRVKSGRYTDYTLTVGGTAGNYVVIEEDPADPGAIIDSFNVAADYIWISGLNFDWDGNGTSFIDTSGIFITTGNAPVSNIIVEGNTFTDYNSGIMLFYEAYDWIVMDNTLTGDQPVGIWQSGTPGDSTGRALALGGENINGGGGHIIAYNSATRFSDGFGCSQTDCDIYGNQIWDMEDDCGSMDGAEQNNRVWGNRMHQVGGNCLSYQPQRGLWYWGFNQVGQIGLDPYKWRVADRQVNWNNTFLGRDQHHQQILYAYSRNNLWIHETTDIWRSNDNSGGCTPPNCTVRPPIYDAGWYTDVDNDGFDWGGSGRIFWWDNNTTAHTTFASFFAETGMEENAIEVDADLIFVDKTRSPTNSLVLASGTNAAVDVGVIIPNLADFYIGSAPDLGAFERGATELHFGPRNTSVELDQRTDYWQKH